MFLVCTFNNFTQKPATVFTFPLLVSLKALPQGQFPQPSCLTLTTYPAPKSIAASFVSTRVRGRSSVAWLSLMTLYTREKRISTSHCHCLSGGVWECTTPPPKSISWKTWMMVRHADAALMQYSICHSVSNYPCSLLCLITSPVFIFPVIFLYKF